MSVKPFKRLTTLALLALTVTCSAWQTPVTLSDPGQDANNPQPAIDASGNANVVWNRSNGSNLIIQGSALPDGGSWSAVADISQAGQNSQGAEVTVDGSGAAFATWARINGVHTIVQAATLPLGGAWSTSVDLSALGQDAKNAQVSVDAAGNAVAVWSRRDGYNWIVQAASRPAGGAWSAPVNVSEAGQNAINPKVAIDGSGNAVAVWIRRNGFNWIAQGAELPLGGAWTAPADLSASGQNAQNPELAVDSSGYAVAIWLRFNGANYIAQGSSLSSGIWSAPVDISAVGRDAQNPQLAVNATGNAVAIWERFNGTSLMLQGATFPFGGAWSAPADISQTGQDVGEHQVAIDAAGNAVAVWHVFNGSRQVIDSSSLPSGGSWSAPVTISNVGDNSLDPQVAMNSGGKAIAVWRSYIGTSWSVQAAINP